MTREQEEKYYLEKIALLKELYEEVDNLLGRGYDGPMMGEEIAPLMKAYIKVKFQKEVTDDDAGVQPVSPTEDGGESTLA
jgi:hypothetical protein